MKILIVEDDFTSRILMHKFLAPYGDVHIAVDGKEALEVVRSSYEEKEPYMLICLDLMMPELDGHAVLEQIRAIEEEFGISNADRIRIIMTTALSDADNVNSAFQNRCDAYMIKPLERAKLLHQLRKLNLIT